MSLKSRIRWQLCVLGILVCVVSSGSVVRAEPRVYFNEEFGFSMPVPDKWIVHRDPMKRGVVAIFNQSKDPLDQPSISITVDALERKSLSAFCQEVARALAPVGFATPVLPKPVQVAGTPGFVFTLELYRPDMKKTVRITQTTFQRGNNAIALLVSELVGMHGTSQREADWMLAGLKSLPLLEDLTQLQAMGEHPPTFMKPDPKVFQQIKAVVERQLGTNPSCKTHAFLREPGNPDALPPQSLVARARMTMNNAMNFEVQTIDFAMGGPSGAADLWRVIGGREMWVKILGWMKAPDNFFPHEMMSKRLGYSRLLSYQRYLEIIRSAPVGGIATAGLPQGLIALLFTTNDCYHPFLGKNLPGTWQTVHQIFISPTDGMIRIAKSESRGKDAEGKAREQVFEQYFMLYGISFNLERPQ